MTQTHTAPVPAVVILSTSSGVQSYRETYYANMLAAEGFAALVVNSFGPRGIATAVEDQGLLTSYQMEADAFGALHFLRASFPGIPPRVSGFEVATVDQVGSEYVVDVRYSNREESFIVQSKWRKLESGWMVVHAERLWAAGDKRPGFLSKLVANILRPLANLRRR